MSISGVRQIVANSVLRAMLRAQIITFMTYIRTSLYLAGWRDSLIWVLRVTGMEPDQAAAMVASLIAMMAFAACRT